MHSHGVFFFLIFLCSHWTIEGTSHFSHFVFLHFIVEAICIPLITNDHSCTDCPYIMFFCEMSHSRLPPLLIKKENALCVYC